MSWVQTHSGIKFDLLEPTPDMVCIEDVAHSLSHLCRYNGHTTRHYSVAEHSWVMSRLVPEEYALDALLHDAQEAYISDLPYPLKQVLGPHWDKLEDRVWRAVSTHFGIQYEFIPIVMSFDRAICLAERRRFMAHDHHDWGIEDPHGIDYKELRGFSPREARDAFMARYEELKR